MNIEITKPSLAMLAFLLTVLPEEDRPASAAAFATSTDIWFCEIDGRPICLWGIQMESILSDRAFIWLITLGNVDRYKFVIARYSKKFVEYLKQHYGYVEGIVDINFTVSVNWLKWLGFSFGPVVNHAGYSVCNFHMRN